MVQQMQSPFLWGIDGKPKSPVQVAQQRRVAEALMAQAPQGKGWASALGQAVQGLGSKVNSTQADYYEDQGREAAGNLFSTIGAGSSTDAIAAALADPAAAWATPGQSGVAEALLNSNLRQEDPAYQLDLAYKQAQLDQLRMGGGDDETFFGNPVPFQDAEGNIQFGQIGNKGTFKPIDLGGGGQFVSPTKTVNTETEQIVMDNFGNVLSRIPIQNQTAAQETAIGTGLGESAVAGLDAGKAAAGNNAKLDILEQTLATAPQGAQGAFVQAAGSIGIDVGGLSDVQAAQAVINQMVPLQRPPGSGTMSDADLALFKQSLPAIINQPEGNRKIIATLRALNDYTIQQTAIEKQVINGSLSRADADRLQQEIPNPLANFNASTAPPNEGWQDFGNGVRIRPIGN